MDNLINSIMAAAWVPIGMRPQAGMHPLRWGRKRDPEIAGKAERRRKAKAARKARRITRRRSV